MRTVGGEGSGDMAGLMQFNTKLITLASIRAYDLCERLNIERAIVSQIYQAMTYCIEQQPQLFFNRHLDQILLSAIYAVCKANKRPENLQFRTIIDAYRQRPHVSEEVFRSVIVEQTPWPALEVLKRDTIIAFYNSVFVPVIRDHLVQVNRSSMSMSNEHDPSHAWGVQGIRRGVRLPSPPLSPLHRSRGDQPPSRRGGDDSPVRTTEERPDALVGSLSPLPMRVANSPRRLAGNVYVREVDVAHSPLRAFDLYQPGPNSRTGVLDCRNGALGDSSEFSINGVDIPSPGQSPIRSKRARITVDGKPPEHD